MVDEVETPAASSAQLLLEHAAFLRALARGMVWSSDEADDLVQETFLAGLQLPVRHVGAVRRWIVRVVRVKRSAALRAQERRGRRERRAAQPEAAVRSAAETVVHQELLARVLDAARSLPEPYRTAIHLRYYRDMTPTGMAESLEIPLATVKSRLRRGLALLRQWMDRRSDGDRQAWCAALLPLVESGPLPAVAATGSTARLLSTVVLMSTRMKTALFIGALVLGGLLAWLALADDGPAEKPIVSETKAHETPATRALPKQSVPDLHAKSDSVQPSREVVREREAQLLTIVVRDSASGQPTSGAQVTVVDSTRFGRLLQERNLDVDMPEARRLEASLSMTAATDATGVACLPVEWESLAVSARKGERWGFRYLREIPDDRRTQVVLGADRSLFVQVIDGNGRPRVGVPVALRCQPGAARLFVHKTTATEENGVATFFHFQRRLASMKGWQVVFAFPVGGHPAVPVNEKTPVSPPCTLVLDGAGSLRVRLRDEAGNPVEADGWNVQVTASSPTDPEPFWTTGRWSRPGFDERGEAVVAWLGLDLHVRVKARKDVVPGAEIEAEVAGPTHDGEEVSCDLVLSDTLANASAPVITGRFVRDDGRAWPAGRARASVKLFPSTREWYPPQEVRVDERGRFQLELRVACPKGGARKYRLEAEDPAGRGQVSTTLDLSEDIPAGGRDIGDVVLDHGPRLVSGRVVDRAGRGIEGVSLYVLGATVVRGETLWPQLPTAGHTRTGKDGAFEIYIPRGEGTPPPRMKLSARHAHYLRSDREFALGESGVTATMEEMGGIAGSLAFQGDLQADDVHVRLEHGNKLLTVQAHEDGSFERQRLRPGQYRFAVYLRSPGGGFQRDAAVIVEQVAVHAGVVDRDPRLQGLAVQSDLTRVGLTVVNGKGVPLCAAQARLAGVSRTRVFQSDATGACVLWVERLPVEIEVTAFGYRNKTVRCAARENRVVLEEGIVVRFFADAPSYGKNPPWRLGLRVREVDASGVARGSVYGSSFPLERRFFDERGEIRIRVPSPGTYELEPFVTLLSKRVGLGGPVGQEPKPRITVVEQSGEQVFRLGIDQRLVEAAVQRYQRE